MIKNLALGGGSNKLLLTFALLLGLLTAVLVGVYLSGLDSDDGGGKTSTVATVPVVVAARDIPALTQVTEDMLTVKALPADVVLPGVFREPAEAVGQTTQVAIVAGEQILPTKVSSATGSIAEFGADAPVSTLLSSGQRAFSIYLSQVAAAGGLVRAGDHIDLLVSIETGAVEEGAATSATACYVLQDIAVLATGGTITQTKAEGDVEGLAGVGTAGETDTLTLAVTPQQAATLAAYQKSVSGNSVGQQLWVALRPFTERGSVGEVPTCAINPSDGTVTS
jgi:pilus assembly protein CpaB